MALEGSGGPETFPHRSWFKDPEQVENLVTLLETTTRESETAPKVWKYGTGHAYRWLFPQVEDEKAPVYPGAPTPKNYETFKVQVSNLASGHLRFGEKIPPELQERFAQVMRARGGEGVDGTRVLRKESRTGIDMQGWLRNTPMRHKIMNAMQFPSTRFADIVDLIAGYGPREETREKREARQVLYHRLNSWFGDHFGPFNSEEAKKAFRAYLDRIDKLESEEKGTSSLQE